MKNLFYYLIIFNLFLWGCSSDSDNQPENVPDVTAPELSINLTGFPSYSSNPIVVSNSIEINIDAKDDGGIAKIEAFLNNINVGEDTTAPYKIIIDVSSLDSKSGSTGKYKDYTLKVIATDKSGNTQSKELIINIDNEKPSIASVSLENGAIINGSENIVTFDISDNEGINAIKIFLNDQLLDELAPETTEININTLGLEDGENILKIEAIDIADNSSFFEVNFISDNTGPEISFDRFTENQVIDETIIIQPEIFDNYSEVDSVEIRLDENSLKTFSNQVDYIFDFDSENYLVGEHTLSILAKDKVGNASSIEVKLNIHRRLITINIPENRIVSPVIIPLVFLSRMDGSMLVQKEISTSDRQITLSVAEEFDINEEFMLSFYLEQYNDYASISTHQHLTRDNPRTLNLTAPKRKLGELESTFKIPVRNFFSSDQTTSHSGRTVDSPTWISAGSTYDGSYNSSENIFTIYTNEVLNDPNPFDSFYLYDPRGGSRYLLLDNPVAENFVLDKEDFTLENLDTKSLTIQSNREIGTVPIFFAIYGALNNEDRNVNKYHSIFRDGRTSAISQPISYALNTTFPFYRHSLSIGNYYTERNGTPELTYQIPNLELDFLRNENQVNLSIQGTEHILGRISCTNFSGSTRNYDWNITFDSQKTREVILPELPLGLTHPVATAHREKNIEVASVSLFSYQSITSYSDYIDKVTKNHNDVLSITDWFQIISSSKTEYYDNKPKREFLFK